MRAARIIGEGTSYYHAITRVIERAFVLNDDEKERFRILLRKTASFSGITVLTHSILDNHTHLVLEVPEGDPVAEEETFRRMRVFYEAAFVAGYAERVRHARKHAIDGLSLRASENSGERVPNTPRLCSRCRLYSRRLIICNYCLVHYHLKK
jgi:REP element-mobilizing transposase RayT